MAAAKPTIINNGVITSTSNAEETAGDEAVREVSVPVPDLVPVAVIVPVVPDVVFEFMIAAKPGIASTYLPLQKQTPAAVELSFTSAPRRYCNKCLYMHVECGSSNVQIY
jgi:hypothetical protein